jgi:hypothetical protein
MSSKVVVGVIALDRALIWRNGLEPKTEPERVKAFEDNAEYRKERDREVGGRDRSTMDDDFCAELVPYFATAETIIFISAGTGKSNAGQSFLDFLNKKHPNVAAKVVEVASADVNKLSENELLALGRERWIASQ